MTEPEYYKLSADLDKIVSLCFKLRQDIYRVYNPPSDK